MEFWIQFILRVSLIAIPLYLCNGLALVFGGTTSVDFGKKFIDGKRLLGDGKTFKGTAAGIFFAFLGVLTLYLFFPQTNELLGTNYLVYGTLLAIGAVAGDFVGSFIKRRIGSQRGTSVFPLDQLDFVLGAFAVGAIVMVPTILEMVFLLALTILAHILGNHIAFFARLKRSPW